MSDKDNKIFWDQPEDDMAEDTEHQVFAFSTNISLSSSNPYSSFKVTTWGDVGNLGFSPSINKDNMHSEIERVIKDLDNIPLEEKNVDECLNVIRYCYNADFDNIGHYVELCVSKLYSSSRSDELKKPYRATPMNETYFHLIRSEICASLNKWDDCGYLCDLIYKKWVHHVPGYRRPYILNNLYINALCTNQWDQSIKYLKHNWTLIKGVDAHKRHSFGLWDEWVCSLVITWFFMKNIKEFEEFFLRSFHTSIDPFNFQKKSLILKNLNSNIISDLIPKFYYEKARELNPQLPDIFQQGT